MTKTDFRLQYDLNAILVGVHIWLYVLIKQGRINPLFYHYGVLTIPATVLFIIGMIGIATIAYFHHSSRYFYWPQRYVVIAEWIIVITQILPYFTILK